MKIEERVNVLSASIGSDFVSVLVEYMNNDSTGYKKTMLVIIETYIDLLKLLIKNDNNLELEKVPQYIIAHICQIHTFTSARSKVSILSQLIHKLIEKGVITGKVLIPTPAGNNEIFNLYREQPIPAKYLSKINYSNTDADQEFEITLSRTCPEKIAGRIKEHVYNFKIVKHHRAPVSDFLNYIFAEHPRWYEQPKVIEGSLLKFRNNLLDKYTRNSAYGRYQNTKNMIKVLIEQKLISSDTGLPNNLRRDTKTQQVRRDNPILCDVDIYDEREKNMFRSVPDFIENLTNDLDKNLKILLEEARKVVFEGYQKFREQEVMISNSEKSEFIKRPDFRIDKISLVTKRHYKANPFWADCELRTNNLVAYYDLFYECLINGTKKHELSGIRSGKEVISYLALSTQIASAMQIIIVEELGINPYSLYKVKVYSTGHGHEFIKITDDGSVRLRTLKLRARHVKTRETKQSLIEPIDVLEQDIDATTCLKMALEMTNRTRALSNQKELWLCAGNSKSGISLPLPLSFQRAFNKLKTKAIKKSAVLEKATLKKVRSSKGVWVYLNSNGDSLKAANYFGNTVKTTLAKYIPDYLTELVYRVKIRSFQNIILFMAVADDESPADSLGLTNENFKKQVVRAFDNPDMGGALYESLKSVEPAHNNCQTKYFCVSLKNIMLALKYAKEGEDASLKNDCISAISKIAEGPIILKQLLRQAEKKLENIKGI